MGIEDLMIGDWVTYTNKYMSSALLCEVVAINNPSGEVILRNLQSNKIDVFGNKDYKVITTRYEDIHPIPLTEVILEKNGFEYDEDREIYYYDENLYVEIDGCDIEISFDRSASSNNGPIIYGMHIEQFNMQVHQFQQVLRLCGMNELANNFKV